MRIGVLGPAGDDIGELGRAARYLVDEARVEKVIYLGDDGALDTLVYHWARAVVGDSPSDDALYVRAAARCVRASPAEIDAFIAREQARQRLRIFTSVQSPQSRALEFVDSRVVLFVVDKAILDEDDIATASIVVFGKASAPLIRKAGARLFVAPGPLGAGSGRAILDDGAGGIRIQIVDGRGGVVAEEHVGSNVVGKVKIRGGA